MCVRASDLLILAAYFQVCAMKRNSYHQPSPEDGQKGLQEKSRNDCLLNGVLPSTDDCSPETEDILSRIDLSKFPSGTRVVQVRPYVILDIPDSWFEEIRNLLRDRTESMYGYRSEEHRKEQLAYLNGRTKKDDK